MILTYTGRHVDPFKLEPKDISIRDIAHALSMTCRWGGHTSRFYSVAEHSVRLVELHGARWSNTHLIYEHDARELERHLLLHDASEAYLTDVPSPYKALPAFAAFVAFEKEVQAKIEAHFGLQPLPERLDAVLHEMDTGILGNEAAHLLPLERTTLTLPAPLDGDPDVTYRAWRGGWPGVQYAPGCVGSGGTGGIPTVTIDRGPWGWTPEVAKANFLDQYTRLFGATE